MLNSRLDRPKVPWVLLAQLVCLRLGHALDDIVIITPELLPVVLLEVKVHEREDGQRICKHRDCAWIVGQQRSS